MFKLDILAEPITYRFIKKYIAKLLRKMYSSKRLNSADREIIEALERLFILNPPKSDDVEDEFDFIALRHMLMLFIILFFSHLVMKAFGYPQLSFLYSLFSSLFFTWLFVMLHIETNQTSRIMLALTWLAFLFSLW